MVHSPSITVLWAQLAPDPIEFVVLQPVAEAALSWITLPPSRNESRAPFVPDPPVQVTLHPVAEAARSWTLPSDTTSRPLEIPGLLMLLWPWLQGVATEPSPAGLGSPGRTCDDEERREGPLGPLAGLGSPKEGLGSPKEREGPLIPEALSSRDEPGAPFCTQCAPVRNACVYLRSLLAADFVGACTTRTTGHSKNSGESDSSALAISE